MIMKKPILMRKVLPTIFLALISSLISCNSGKSKKESNNASSPKGSVSFKSGYSDVNGIKMYYEIYGQGEPLVLIHGGGSTIQTSFERIIPSLAKNYQVIAVEL